MTTDYAITVRISYEDVRDIAADNDVDVVLAFQRVAAWAKHIEATASSLAWEQVQSVIISDQP